MTPYYTKAGHSHISDSRIRRDEKVNEAKRNVGIKTSGEITRKRENVIKLIPLISGIISNSPKVQMAPAGFTWAVKLFAMPE